MKLNIALTCCFIIIIFFSCSKSGSNPGPDAALAGKWNLIETLTDPGDGSGKWHPVNSTGAYIQFNSDSSFNVNLANSSMPSLDVDMIHYSVGSDSTISFIDSSADKYNRRYIIKEHTLTITGGCYEACGSRFIKE